MQTTENIEKKLSLINKQLLNLKITNFILATALVIVSGTYLINAQATTNIQSKGKLIYNNEIILDSSDLNILQSEIDNKHDNINIKTYSDVQQLGIDSWFIPDIIKAMPRNSYFCCDVSSGIKDETRNKLPLGLGVITIEKPSNSRYRVLYSYSASGARGQIYEASVDLVNLVVNNWYSVGYTSYSKENIEPDGVNSTIDDGVNYFWVEKSGNLATMYGRIHIPNELEVNEWYTIGQLPEGYYPKYSHGYMLFSVYNGSYIECTVSSDGVILIRPQGTPPKGWFPVVTTSWFVE